MSFSFSAEKRLCDALESIAESYALMAICAGQQLEIAKDALVVNAQAVAATQALEKQLEKRHES